MNHHIINQALRNLFAAQAEKRVIRQSPIPKDWKFEHQNTDAMRIALRLSEPLPFQTPAALFRRFAQARTESTR